jgi:hypothetical protein
MLNSSIKITTSNHSSKLYLGLDPGEEVFVVGLELALLSAKYDLAAGPHAVDGLQLLVMLLDLLQLALFLLTLQISQARKMIRVANN